ncbi:MAG TPA: PIN domain-containing protein [archaeon]|nr:PIN domain-containing protein [archaeon]
MKFIIDSYAWIEYFKASAIGEKAKKIIEKKENELFTLDVCLAEIKFWALGEKTDFSKIQFIIKSDSAVVETFSNDWLEAAEIKFEKRKKHKNFGLVDALLLAKQKQLNATILTGDKHFEENPKVELI